MKTILAAALILAAIPAHSSLPQFVATAQATLTQELGCTRDTLGEAFRGDFSRIALPGFVPGNHLRAGQLADCMPPR
ncbi:MAG: hypothetical protein AAB368_15180 [bacterium]